MWNSLVCRNLISVQFPLSDGNSQSFHRAVYDGEEPEKFMDRLDVRIKGHDKEIERMCNYHYQGFIESIRSLLQVRGQVESIKVNSFPRMKFVAMCVKIAREQRLQSMLTSEISSTG